MPIIRLTCATLNCSALKVFAFMIISFTTSLPSQPITQLPVRAK